MKRLKSFETYTFEDFTHSDYEDVKELLEDGLSESQISIELDLDPLVVKQIVDTIIRKQDLSGGTNRQFNESKKSEKSESLEDCPSFKEFNKAIADLKKVTKKIHSELKRGTKGEIDDYIEKKIFGRDV